jgi:hypothetical protein
LGIEEEMVRSKDKKRYGVWGLQGNKALMYEKV